MTELPAALRQPIRTNRDLAAALLALDELAPADSAEEANKLIAVAQPVLARYRRRKWLEAYEATGDKHVSQTELAARGDVTRAVVTKRIARAREERAAEQAAEQGAVSA